MSGSNQRPHACKACALTSWANLPCKPGLTDQAWTDPWSTWHPYRWEKEKREGKAQMCLVELRRVELLTPCVQSRCSTNWAITPYSRESAGTTTSSTLRKMWPLAPTIRRAVWATSNRKLPKSPLGSPCPARTGDSTVNSRVLYRLS